MCSTPAGQSRNVVRMVNQEQVNEVNVLFVAAQGRRFIGDLSQSDITVRDDNKAPAAILGFRTEKELPLRVALLIDTSDSLASRFHFEQAAASAFLRQSLSQASDEGFVMGFSDYQNLMQDFTHDPDLLAQGVERLKIGGGTALYDAVVPAVIDCYAAPRKTWLHAYWSSCPMVKAMLARCTWKAPSTTPKEPESPSIPSVL